MASRLRYVRDDGPGITREAGPLGVRYRRPDGRLIRQGAELKRIRGLVIPPAWTRVWICCDPAGHIQATGRDAKGRKQYRYHPEWRASREETKFDRMQGFAQLLPAIRSRTQADLSKPGLPREKVLATVVQLLERSLIRVGNDEYAKTNRSFGLTTLEDRHVKVEGTALRFRFRGKSGVRHDVAITDRRLARIVKACRDLPGQQLFQYVDDDGEVQDVNSADVNAYLKEISGEDVTAKDFRTWAGTVLALTALRAFEQAESLSEAKRNLVRAIDAVAGVLGNTRSVCRKSYIHPAILDSYVNGGLGVRSPRRLARGLRPEEDACLSLLKAVAVRSGRRRAA